MRSLFVLGGARSGKSRYAQARAEALAGSHLFIATAQAYDEEMADRIARHRADRGPIWQTVEAPLDLVGSIRTHAAEGTILLVDCLTLWASNMMLADHDAEVATAGLADAIRQAPGHIIIVSNEVGLGIVPDNPLARRFRDIAGRINQAIAAISNEAIFMAAGLPLQLK